MEYKEGDFVNGQKLLETPKSLCAYLRVLCQHCGGEYRPRFDHVRTGMSTSCGCVYKGRKKHLQTTFAGHRSDEYKSWHNMMNRCYKQNHHQYFRYGAKGVKVCERWHDLNNFIEDMGKRPSPLHTLDRYPDNNGNYEPGNCRWATPKEQSRNLRNNVVLTHNGETKTVMEWCELLGVNYARVRHRIRMNIGLTSDEILFLPKNASVLYNHSKKV